MLSAVLSRSPGAAVRRAIVGLCAALVVVTPLILLLLAVETTPRVVSTGPPDALVAERTRDVADSLRALAESDAADGGWSADEDELNAVLTTAGRLQPGLLGHVAVNAGGLVLDASVGAPLMPVGLWTNLHLELPASEHGLRIESARVGRLPIPPALALAGLRIALDRALGDQLGTEALASIAALRLDPPRMTVALRFDGDGGAEFFDRLRDRALQAAGVTARQRVYVQLAQLQKAVRRGRLPRRGTMLPYLLEASAFASRPSQAADREEFRAALYALALYCGDPAFGNTIGAALDARMQGGANGCEGTRLAGRDDLKRHFVVSAGLYAATTGKAAFGMGELKELLDSNAGGEGFSFDDLTADMAGVRFAEAFLAAPRSAWPAMLARISTEADIMPSIDGLPEGFDESAFRERFGTVDSPAYAAVVAEIKRRIDALPLYADPLSD